MMLRHGNRVPKAEASTAELQSLLQGLIFRAVSPEDSIFITLVGLSYDIHHSLHTYCIFC
jgi:hypothetical protein